MAHQLEKAVWACVVRRNVCMKRSGACFFREATGLPSCFFHAAWRYNCLLCGPIERRSFTYEHHGDCTHTDTSGRCLGVLQNTLSPDRLTCHLSVCENTVLSGDRSGNRYQIQPGPSS